MPAPGTYLAFDLGASNGRAIVGSLHNNTFTLEVVHRFETPVTEASGHLYWDAATLKKELRTGLKKARQKAGTLQSISVTSWGVDYVPLGEDGRPLRNPYCYRDGRTAQTPEQVYRQISEQDFYRTTGIGTMSINTVFQLCWERDHDPELFARTANRLPIADYFNYVLSGVKATERSLASTTQMLDATTGTWASELLQTLGIAEERLAPIVPSATILGPLQHSWRRSDEQTRVDGHGDTDQDGGQAEMVVAGCSHDTACAMATVLTLHPHPGRVFLSSGTWSLLGVEQQRPILSDEARTAGFTNESGPGQTIRFLKNLTGLWVLQECEREWKQQQERYTYEQLMEEAALAAAEQTPPVIDLDDPPFAEPGNMTSKLQAYCRRHGLAVPETRGALVAAILHSLAHTYARTIRSLETLTGDTISHIHVVGGGSQNRLLCQWTADSTGCEVLAGPVEASATGNILMQARAMGHLPDNETLRDMLARLEPLKTYTPRA